MNVPKGALPNARAVDKYLEFLACPNCKASLSLKQGQKLTCYGCMRTFDIIDNFPILLPASLSRDAGWQKWKDMDAQYQEYYKNWSKEKHLAARPIYDAFYDWCGVRDIQNVSLLDIGGGNGTSRVMYWKYPKKTNYFNVDPTINFLHPFHLESYPKMKEIDFPYIVGVGEYLPLKSNTFDICITTAAIDHYNSPVDVFHEIFRCLKPQRKLYAMVSKHTSAQTKDMKSMRAAFRNYYHKHGIIALTRRMARGMVALPSLRKEQIKDTHVHHFNSLEELTQLVYMFRITRTKETGEAEGNQIYVECLKE